MRCSPLKQVKNFFKRKMTRDKQKGIKSHIIRSLRDNLCNHFNVYNSLLKMHLSAPPPCSRGESVNMATPQRSPPCQAPGCSIQSPHGGWAGRRNTAAGAATPALPTGIELQRFGKGSWREGAQTQAEALTQLTSNIKSRATLSAKQVPLSPSLRIWPF